LARFGSADAVLRAGADRLREVPSVGPHTAEEITTALRTLDVDAELARMAKHGVSLRARGAPDYPASLFDIPDSPPLLYVRGSLQEADSRAVAVVGTRHPTGYGKRVAERLAAGLARAGYTVVSGLARGIDGIAHKAALAAGGRTLAVLANGLSRVYPPEHAGLADEVAASGALLTEAPMERAPLAELFPVRNRIISGLSRAVVIVEAAEQSGTLITAEHAAEQGRPVLAVPGPTDSPASAGCHELIRQGAVLCRGVEDVLEEVQGVSTVAASAKAAETPPAPPPEMDEPQRRAWEFLADGPRHLDEMVQRLGVNVAELSGVLLMLEMKRAVRRLPGNRYERR
jgi:DNA processing protein